MPSEMTMPEILRWHIDAGADECIGQTPVNRFAEVAPAAEPAPAAQPRSAVRAAAVPPSGMPETRGAPVDKAMLSEERAVKSAVQLAQAATDIAGLRAALETFDGCPLKKTATNLVLCDGPATAKLMFVGEAPGAEEDRQGVPFVGPSGHLLDAILASVGITRSDVIISNTVFWRPPGNRTPSSVETAVCQPFIERLIEIVDPKILVCIGGPAAKVLLGVTQGVGRMRGKWFEYSSLGLTHPVAATVIFHPAYLLRTPMMKRETWKDIRAIHRRLAQH